MRSLVYADNAATTRMDEDAFEVMKPFLLNEYGNASQPYSFSRVPKKAIQEARETVASCIGADPNEIYFTSGGTESDNWAIKGTFAVKKFRAMTTTAFEHHAVLKSCEWLNDQGVHINYLMPTHEGIISVDTIDSTIREQLAFVSIMFVNNEIGTLQPIKALASKTHEYGGIFHTDAVQAVGHLPINVHELDVDLLSASAHKFNGPKGVGFLYIRDGLSFLPYENGGAQERGLRAGTENVAGIVGMSVALLNNCRSLEQQRAHIKELDSIIMTGLAEAGISFKRNGKHAAIPGIMSLSFPEMDAEAMLHRLDLMGISVSTGAACNSVNTQVSHVLRAIKLPEEFAKGTIRISLGKNNTEGDAKTIVHAIAKIIKA